MPPALVFVCTTCVRDRSLTAPSQGTRLARALRERLAGMDTALEVREVACLNACRNPCNVGLRGSQRWTYRFSRCTLTDVDALLETAQHYWADARGALSPSTLPASLRDKVSACTPPPDPA